MHSSDSTSEKVWNESVPIQLAQCRFPGQAISSAKILIYLSNKIHGSNFIKQYSETVMVWNYQNCWLQFKKKMVVIIFCTLVLHYRCGVGLNSRARWRACVSGRRRSGGRAWHCWRWAGGRPACLHTRRQARVWINQTIVVHGHARPLPPSLSLWGGQSGCLPWAIHLGLAMYVWLHYLGATVFVICTVNVSQWSGSKLV